MTRARKAASATPILGAEDALTVYSTMVQARQFEEQLGAIFAEGRLAGWFHSCIGHEAVGATFGLLLRETDHVIPYHRSRATLFARGMSAREIAAEMMARAEAQSRGRGGDGHIVHPGLRIYGMSGSLGASIPIAAGVAYAAKLRGEGEVVLNGFGEGTANRGAVHEGINLGAIWDLPIVFICENNLYAEFSPIKDQMGADHVVDRAAGYGIPGVIVDGNDPEAVLPVVREAVERARAGGGPTLIEAKTYRLRGHYEGDPQAYRDKAEVEEWTAKDPLKTFRARLLDDGRADEDTLDRLEGAIVTDIAGALEAAYASPLPEPAALLEDVYADGAVTA